MKKIIISALLSITCLFAETPNIEPSSGNSCFKQRNVGYNLEDTFEGLKKVLMQSNLNIATVTKQDGVLTARGNQYNGETITEVTVSLSFKQVDEENTHVAAIASYSTMKKKLDTGQIGISGLSLPIPVPLTGKYAVVGSGNIDSSEWYSGFFNSLEKVIFEDKIKNLQ